SRANEDQKWGFFWKPEELKSSSRRILREGVAAPGSPFGVWNKKNPEIAALPGDELVEVNSAGRSPEAIAKELKGLIVFCVFQRAGNINIKDKFRAACMQSSARGAVRPKDRSLSAAVARAGKGAPPAPPPDAGNQGKGRPPLAPPDAGNK
ncbi:dgoA, partial [Symbiodinium pilosum]